MPANGPGVGGNVVTLQAVSVFSTRADVAAVSLCGVSAVILSQTASTITVLAGNGTSLAGSSACAVSVTPNALSAQIVSGSAYTYNTLPVIASVAPVFIAYGSAVVLTISGANLGDGNDIAGVTMCGQSATIVSQSANVVIVSAVAIAAQACNVSVHSVSRGSAISSTGAVSVVPTLVVIAPTVDAVEAGLAVTFTVSLSTAADATVAISTDSFLSAVPSSLTFTTANSHVPQQVAISAVRDFQVTGTRNANVGFALAGLPAQFTVNCSVAIQDVDQAALTVIASHTTTNGILLVTEGDSAVVSVRLRSRPTSSVTVSISVRVTGRAVQASPSSVTFAPSEWNEFKNFTVTAVDDLLLQPYLAQSVLTLRVSSSAFGFTSLQDSVLQMYVLDDDLGSGVEVVFSNTLANVSEAGITSHAYALLIRDIVGDLSIRAQSSNTAEGVVMPAMVVLTQINKLVPVLFTIRGVDDQRQDGDQHFTVTLDAPGASQTLSWTSELWNLDNDTAGVTLSHSNVTVSETGLFEVVTVRVASEPYHPVQVTVVSSNTAEVHVTPTQFTVTAQSVLAITIRGLRDTQIDSDAVVPVHITLTSNDAAYNHMLSVMVTNQNVYWPEVYNVTPTAFALVGTNATLHTRYVMPGVAVSINNVPALRVVVNADGTLVTFLSPSINETGRMQLRLTNPDGGWFTSNHSVFYTEVCRVGSGLCDWNFGYRTDCRECHPHACCPGGYRMVPHAGYWTHSDDSGTIVSCMPTAACLEGGICAPGYNGTRCADCSPDFYRLGERCAECNSVGTQAALIVIQFAFSALMILAIVFASDSVLANVTFVLQSMRVLWVINVDSETGLPDALTYTIFTFNLFAGDLNFIQPGCAGLETFSENFLLRTIVMLGLFLPLIAALYIKHRCRRARHLDNKPSDTYDTEFKQDVVASACTLLEFMYEMLLVSSFKALFCRPITSSTGGLILELVEGSSEACFKGSHTFVFMMALLLVTTVGVLWPVLVIRAKWKHNSRLAAKQPVLSNTASYTVMRVMTEDFRIGYGYFGPVTMLAVDFLLSATSVFLSDSSLYWAQFIVMISILTMYLVSVVALRPFRDPYKNVGLVVVLVVAILTQLSSLLTKFQPEYRQLLLGVAYASVALLCAFFVGVLVLVLYSLCRRTPRVAPTDNDDVLMKNKMAFAQDTQRELAIVEACDDKDQSEVSLLAVLPSHSEQTETIASLATVASLRRRGNLVPLTSLARNGSMQRALRIPSVVGARPDHVSAHMHDDIGRELADGAASAAAVGDGMPLPQDITTCGASEFTEAQASGGDTRDVSRDNELRATGPDIAGEDEATEAHMPQPHVSAACVQKLNAADDDGAQDSAGTVDAPSDQATVYSEDAAITIVQDSSIQRITHDASEQAPPEARDAVTEQTDASSNVSSEQAEACAESQGDV
eukprot:TRINITY_DN6530_c0_g1_i6.p1 TRINITY_DN6530_c0_g1~~TRINITY_DN6530_c0_g1_i6.p1  ORF type:complete len:1428 (+),score=314.15 TRINITY_DN6530_c0_g1_i6:3167-7450(+)